MYVIQFRTQSCVHMSCAHEIKMTVAIPKYKNTRAQKYKIKRDDVYIAISLGR